MRKLGLEEYMTAARYIDGDSPGAVYPLSIAEYYQPGDVYMSGASALFRHRCGFAFVFGECGPSFLDEIYGSFLSEGSAVPGRFVLFASGGRVKKYFQGKDNILTERRMFFENPGNAAAGAPELPGDMRLSEMDTDMIDRLAGRITPRFSWDDMPEFLSRGKGYCVLDGNVPAAWAFSAAVSGEEIDIGVETAPGYRRRGLAAAAVSAMIRYILRQGKRPVWACGFENTASAALSERSGFIKTAECVTVRKRG